MLQVRGQTSKSVTIKRRINSFCSIVKKVVCTIVIKIKMNRFIFIFLVVISLGISVFCVRKKCTHTQSMMSNVQYLFDLLNGSFKASCGEKLEGKKRSCKVLAG